MQNGLTEVSDESFFIMAQILHSRSYEETFNENVIPTILVFSTYTELGTSNYTQMGDHCHTSFYVKHVEKDSDTYHRNNVNVAKTWHSHRSSHCAQYPTIDLLNLCCSGYSARRGMHITTCR
jgi:hypothetical protein